MGLYVKSFFWIESSRIWNSSLLPPTGKFSYHATDFFCHGVPFSDIFPFFLSPFLYITVFVLFIAQVLLNAHHLITEMSAEIFFQASCQTACDSDRRKGVLKIYHTYVAKHMSLRMNGTWPLGPVYLQLAKLNSLMLKICCHFLQVNKRTPYHYLRAMRV